MSIANQRMPLTTLNRAPSIARCGTKFIPTNDSADSLKDQKVKTATCLSQTHHVSSLATPNVFTVSHPAYIILHKQLSDHEPAQRPSATPDAHQRFFPFTKTWSPLTPCPAIRASVVHPCSACVSHQICSKFEFCRVPASAGHRQRPVPDASSDKGKPTLTTPPTSVPRRHRPDPSQEPLVEKGLAM
jgi:hypothetical protein